MKLPDTKNIFYQRFGYSAQSTVLAPGRINLIGDHTDYNGGWVLPATINRYISMSWAKNKSGKCRIYAVDLDQYVEFNASQIQKLEYGWANYFIGILLEFRKLKVDAYGFDICFSGNIPKGGGMSSSSSIECAFLILINEFYEFRWPLEMLLKISQSNNHQFLGLKGGLMDQYSIMHGKKNRALLLDCSTYQHRYIPLHLGDYCILTVNTLVEHELVNSPYNVRVQECMQALKMANKYITNVHSLSDLTIENVVELKKFCPLNVFNRAKHVLDENRSVIKFAKNMSEGDLIQCGQLMFASHKSLKELYKVSCPELDFLVEECVTNPFVLGSRMMGGGFGGCTISIVKKDKLTQLIDNLSTKYFNQFSLYPQCSVLEIEDGVRFI